VVEFRLMDNAKPSLIGLFHKEVKTPLCQCPPSYFPHFPNYVYMAWALETHIEGMIFILPSTVQNRLLPQRLTCMTFRTVNAPPCQRVTMSRTAYSCGRKIPILNFGLAKVSCKLLCGFSQSVHTDPSTV
jgi:hypothetical protein